MSKKNTRILLVDDEEIVRESLSGWLEKDGYTIGTAPDGLAGVKAVEEGRWSILLVDLKMPGIDGLEVLRRVKEKSPETAVVIMTAYATVDTAVNAMKIGAFDYIVKPFDPEEVSLLVEKIVAQQALVRENVILRKALKREYRFHDLVTKSPAMQGTLELARTAARSPSTILILGESGTGKELLARAIHAESPRHDRPFVAMSCAALTETLLESELFGYEKGSFTGADGAPGGQVRGGERRHALPRRDRRHQPEAAARPPARPRGAPRHARRRDGVDPGGRPHHRGDEPRPREGRRRRTLPGRPLLPAERHHAHARAAARPQGGHPAPRRHPPRAARRRDEKAGRGRVPGGDGAPPRALVAGQRARAAQRPRARRRRLERARSSSPPTSASRCAGRRFPSHPASLAEIERQHIAAVLQNTGGNVSQAARILDIDRVTLYNKIHKFGLKRADDGVFEPATER